MILVDRRSMFYRGTWLFNMGIFFVRRAPLYIERPCRILAEPYEVKSVKIIGRKSSVFDVVSSIITARQYVILVAPLSTAAAPRIAIVSGLMHF
jgi:hypothetical protein